MLRIEIVDNECEEDEAHVFLVPLDTDKKDIMTAIGVFFPTATTIYMVVEE